MAILNAYNLYLVKTGERIPLKVFCNGLVQKILERYGTPTSVLRGRALSRPNLPDRLGGRDIARHYLIPLPPPEKQEGETSEKRKIVNNSVMQLQQKLLSLHIMDVN